MKSVPQGLSPITLIILDNLPLGNNVVLIDATRSSFGTDLFTLNSSSKSFTLRSKMR